MVIYPPERLPTMFIPICFACGLSVDMKNKVPSIIWEEERFLPELPSESLETEPRPA